MTNSPGIRQPASPRSVRLVTAFLWLALCALCASWAMTLLLGPSLPMGSITAPGSSRPLVDAATTANALQAHAQLFGAGGAPHAGAPEQKSESLRALGIIADRKGRGAVLLSIDGQPARPYRTGDQVAGRVVAALRGNQVELDHNGQREVLTVPQAGSPTAARNSAENSAGNTTANNTANSAASALASTRTPGTLGRAGSSSSSGTRGAVLSNQPAATPSAPAKASP